MNAITDTITEAAALATELVEATPGTHLTWLAVGVLALPFSVAFGYLFA
jgi:hypothetical protein